MRSDFAYDPVTAIDESAAVGETTLVFAEIRRIMDIPLVTSIWRGLAGMDDSLRPVWDAAKPIYESGEPERALARSIAVADLPSPEPLAPTALTCIGMMGGDVRTVRAVIAAYNRSNGLNLVALAALIAPPTTEAGAVPAAVSQATPALSPQALAVITGYVRSPAQVARMVAIGHTLATWLAR